MNEQKASSGGTLSKGFTVLELLDGLVFYAKDGQLAGEVGERADEKAEATRDAILARFEHLQNEAAEFREKQRFYLKPKYALELINGQREKIEGLEIQLEVWADANAELRLAIVSEGKKWEETCKELEAEIKKCHYD